MLKPPAFPHMDFIPDEDLIEGRRRRLKIRARSPILRFVIGRAVVLSARFFAPLSLLAYSFLFAITGMQLPLLGSAQLDFLYVFGGAAFCFSIGFLICLPAAWLRLRIASRLLGVSPNDYVRLSDESPAKIYCLASEHLARPELGRFGRLLAGFVLY